MLKAEQLKGIYVPAATPFRPNGELDPDSYRTYVADLLERGIDGIVVAGTTGESPTIVWEEAETLLRETIEAAKTVPRFVPIVVGTGTNDTASSVRRTEAAGRAGADAVLVVTPYYSRPSEEGIVEHFRRIAATGVPVIAYENPSRTGIRLSADAMRRILELDGVIGLKDSSGNTDLIRELARFDAKPILCGNDELFLDFLGHGAAGGILAAANLRAELFAEAYRLFASGDRAAARTAFDELLPLVRALFKEPNPAPLKWLLARRGRIASEAVRLPMSPITEALQAELASL